MIKILDEPLDVEKALKEAQSDQAGAVNIFVGSVRYQSRGKTVKRLEYDVYEKMAIAEIQKVVTQAESKWPVQKAVVYHRKGVLSVGQIAVIIAVSTPHRKASFEACQFIIDTLKRTAPIWKKEIYESGETWIDEHP